MDKETKKAIRYFKQAFEIGTIISTEDFSNFYEKYPKTFCLATSNLNLKPVYETQITFYTMKDLVEELNGIGGFYDENTYDLKIDKSERAYSEKKVIIGYKFLGDK